MTLADFTAPRLVVPQLRGADAASAIKELSEVLHTEGCVPDVLPFYQAALNREFMSSTDMEAGMAFPHARVASAHQVAFALGRCDQPLRWCPQGAESVRLVFLLAVPTTDATQYLQLLSGLVRLSKDGALVDRLLGARTTPQMLEVLQAVGLRAAPVTPKTDAGMPPVWFGPTHLWKR